ncbi:hypothetical protein [Brevundimonas diminuta]|uniref:hypothetical protein n=1 Tax=Brevundimonas diminuta TaxID=293 RepID=UPI001F56BC0C|nr:hypothetical protein [Brevundimonas diminuta]
MRNTCFTACLVAAGLIATPLIAQDNVISGIGSAPVTRDLDAVRMHAEDSAKVELVRAIARQVLGDERIAELSPDVLRRLAAQIRPDMIVDRSSVRVGQEFRTTLSARVDRAWFQQLLDDEGIQSSLDRAGGQEQRIIVLLDESIGTAQDFERPVEVVTEYDRSTGSSFNDTSVLAASERRQSASSASAASGSTYRGSSAAGYSDGYGSAAVRGSASGASASRSRSSSASSASSSLIDRTDVQASTHDDVRYRQRVTYQSAASSQTGAAAMASLTGSLQRYGVATSNAVGTLAEFSPGPTPLYGDLRQSGRLREFFAHASRSADAPFFMGGELSVRYEGRNPATGAANCSGMLTATTFATADMADVASANVSAPMSASSYELCASQLSSTLARQAAEEMGPRIQNYWRRQSRNQVQRVAAATGASDYTLTVRAAELTMAAQADFLDALTGLPGVESQAFLGQADGQMDMQVRYGGSTPLHLALYQRLRNNPAFSAMETESVGQQVIVCLSGC